MAVYRALIKRSDEGIHQGILRKILPHVDELLHCHTELVDVDFHLLAILSSRLQLVIHDDGDAIEYSRAVRDEQ